MLAQIGGIGRASKCVQIFARWCWRVRVGVCDNFPSARVIAIRKVAGVSVRVEFIDLINVVRRRLRSIVDTGGEGEPLTMQIH